MHSVAGQAQTSVQYNDKCDYYKNMQLNLEELFLETSFNVNYW